MGMSRAYRVEQQGRGCERCGHGNVWSVVGPDDIAHSVSWTEQQDAVDFAEAMNEAYEKGHAAAYKQLPIVELQILQDEYRRELRKDTEMSEHIEVIRIVPVVLEPPTSEMMTLVDVQRICDGRSKLLRITVA